MPELPEVETTKEGIKQHIEGQTISRIVVRNPKLRIPIVFNINELCTQKIIHHVSRRGKYLLLHLCDSHILIHLGMSGHLRVVPENTKLAKHDHVDVVLNNNKILRYCDPRRFGLFHYFTEDPKELKLLSHLGPEPLTELFNPKYLFDKAKNKNTPIKSFIMANEVVVGVGNIYATESLFLAGINPKSPAKFITYEQCISLVEHIKTVLQAAILAGGTTLKDFYGSDGKPGYFNYSLNVYGRYKQACLHCDTTIETTLINGRNSAFCPTCQPLLSN